MLDELRKSQSQSSSRSIQASGPMTIDDTPLLLSPRVVTPTHHHKTDKEQPSLRYSLENTSKSSSSKSLRQQQKLKEAHAMALQKSPNSGKKPKLTSSKIIPKQDPNAFKIFLLLLQPTSKIFELIQLFYSPYDATVGNLLQMIPKNATEKALGSQTYIGLCRPKTQEELLDLQELASEVRPGVDSAKITLGEILVAIPEGFTGPDVAALSKQILANPKIVKLLRRADPLAPKKRKSSRRHRHRSSRTTNREQVHVLEKHEEVVEEDFHHASERSMQLALDKAAAEAEAANAAIPGGGSSNSISSTPKYMRSNSMETGNSSMDFSAQESLDESYASWSKSFDASFSAQSSVCSGVSRRALVRRQRQVKRMRLVRFSGIAAFFVMILLYWFDPNNSKEALHEAHTKQTQAPMGLLGLIQCLVLLLTLYKIERLIHHSQSDYMSEDRRCPFLKACFRSLKKFQAKYKKRLRKKSKAEALQAKQDLVQQQQQHRKPRMEKLRSFSLKGPQSSPTTADDLSDTGSL